MSARPVELSGYDGTRLRGTLHLPDAPGPHPGVVMAHGFSATRDMGVERMAAVLADTGFAALAYDHRNLGESDGEPRGEINPFAQMRDYRSALGWLAARAGVDGDRLGVWGSSFSGGEVLVVGAVDDRVRAVVAQVPFAGTAEEVDDPDGSRFEALRSAVIDPSEPLPGADEDPLGPLPVVADPPGGACFLADPHATEWFLAHAGARWRNAVTIAGLLGDPPFDPGVAAAHVGAPTLMIVADDDALAPAAIARAAFARIPTPKRLVEVSGHHFVVYGDTFDTAAGATVAFLREHLGS